MRKFSTLNHYGKSDKQKAVHKLDTALSLLVRSTEEACATCGQQHDVYDCGHFRRRECMATRFDYKNVAKQGVKENRFEGGKPYEFGLFIDKKWGKGTAQKLYRRSQEIWQWEVSELDCLTDCAKRGMNVYMQQYDIFAAKKEKK
jgi:hypothetical protein